MAVDHWKGKPLYTRSIRQFFTIPALYHIDIQNKFSNKSLKAKNIQIQRGRNKSGGNTVQIHFLRVLIGNNLIQFGHIRTAIIVKLAPDTTSFRKVFENHCFEAKK